jgi:hypothetical protein
VHYSVVLIRKACVSVRAGERDVHAYHSLIQACTCMCMCIDAWMHLSMPVIHVFITRLIQTRSKAGGEKKKRQHRMHIITVHMTPQCLKENKRHKHRHSCSSQQHRIHTHTPSQKAREKYGRVLRLCRGVRCPGACMGPM